MTNAKAVWVLRTFPAKHAKLMELIKASRGSYQAKLIDEYNYLVTVYNEALNNQRTEADED